MPKKSTQIIIKHNFCNTINLVKIQIMLKIQKSTKKEITIVTTQKTCLEKKQICFFSGRRRGVNKHFFTSRHILYMLWKNNNKTIINI